MKIRVVRIEDASRIQEIYAPYVKNTNITFEYIEPSVEEMASRIEKTLKNYPYLVVEDEGKVVGYAYASRYQERKAYDWDCDLSIYLEPFYQGKGIAKVLYMSLMMILKKMNYQNVYACITHPNEKSERFHRQLGFDLVGCFHHSGYKFKKWHDMVWMEKHIGCYDDVKEIIPFEMLDKKEIELCLMETYIQENNIML